MKRLLLYSVLAFTLAGCSQTEPIYNSPAVFDSYSVSTRSRLHTSFETPFTKRMNIQIVPAVDNNSQKYLLFRFPTSDGYNQQLVSGSCVKEEQFGDLLSAVDSMLAGFAVDRRNKSLKYAFKSVQVSRVEVNGQVKEVPVITFRIDYSLNQSEFWCRVKDDNSWGFTIRSRSDLEQFYDTIQKAIAVLN